MKKNILLADFSANQSQRYHAILPILGKVAIKVISNLKGRGRNSWKSITENIQAVNNPQSDQEAEYFRLLDQEVDLEEKLYTKEQFTQIVCGVRFKVGLPAFDKKITKQCEQEMFKLFMWDEVYAPVDVDKKIVLLGYRPICRLKAD